jgi:2,4-dienoyl-CoA reductase-like NADH-dependent reductase (Old Yellow Enzyme family)
MQQSLFQPLRFASGHSMNNRFMVAPMTNTQSHDDGTLSEDEYKWLTLRAKGGFGLTMTCASHVVANGQGFPGQLGIFDDKHIEGHRRLAAGIKAHQSLAVLQLHHAGVRSPKELIKTNPVGPSVHVQTAAIALSTTEVHQLKDAFIDGAVRAQKSGYDGVEIHGAHGYILAQFLSTRYNQRTDEYGGSLLNRQRLILEIITGIRLRCGASFMIGLRLSPERYGLDLAEIKDFCQQLDAQKAVDFLDISLWDVFKMPEDAHYADKTLLEHFSHLRFKHTAWTVAGKIKSAVAAQHVLAAGVDFVCIGQAAILHHDFPQQIKQNPNFESRALPVSASYLQGQGLGPKFVQYMRRWPNFVAP